MGWLVTKELIRLDLDSGRSMHPEEVVEPAKDSLPPTTPKTANVPFPASGICPYQNRDIVNITINVDNTSSPRCVKVLDNQFLSINNNTHSEIKLKLGQFVLSIEPGDSHFIDMPFEEYLVPGVHSLDVVGTPTGAEIWFDPTFMRLDTSDWKAYRNEEFGFEMKYPPEWRVLRADNYALDITYMQNTVSMAILNFRPPSKATFQDWVNEIPHALTKFRDRDALRWSSRGISTPTLHESNGGTENLIILLEGGDLALSLNMAMKDATACHNCLEIFEHMVESLVFWRL